jgi:acyl-coenzyme A thioesterase PaaI-like protein
VDLNSVLARIPYLEPHELEISQGEEHVVVSMNALPGLVNHVGILHAGALFTAAETAAGVAAYGVIPDDKAFVLLRSAKVRYTRRAEGAVSARAVVEADLGAVRRTFGETGRGDVLTCVRVFDEGAELVFEGEFDYALRPRGKA